jgi:hypothetical protein
MEELILSKIASDYSFSKVLTKITFKTNTKHEVAFLWMDTIERN